MRLIDADDLKPNIDKFIGYLDEDMIYRIKVVIDNAPTVEERKEGHWIENDYQPFDYDTVFKCSICGKEIFVNDHQAAKVFEHDKYCFNCGAKMINPKTLIDKVGPVLEQIAETATNFFEDETISGLLEEGEE